jgi:hypothetical protein
VCWTRVRRVLRSGGEKEDGVEYMLGRIMWPEDPFTPLWDLAIWEMPVFRVKWVSISISDRIQTLPIQILFVEVISMGGSNSMQFNYSICLWQQLQRHHRPSYYVPYFISITPPQPSNTTPCGTPYFPTNQPSKPSRGVRLN